MEIMMDRVYQLMKFFVADKIMDDDVAQAHTKKKPQAIKQVTSAHWVHCLQFYGTT